MAEAVAGVEGGGCLLGITMLYFALPPLPYRPAPELQAKSPGIDYQLTTSDLQVDWPAGGSDFDPRSKCPEDFLARA